MSDKPFWKDKTNEQLDGLHVKVTFENGAIVTGEMGPYGYVKPSNDGSDYLYISSTRGNGKFIPRSCISSIELVGDTDYKRIDFIEDVRAGDIFVAKDGNRYPIREVDFDDEGAMFSTSLPYGASFWLGSKAFSYALRPKLQLPYRDGLWFDKDDATWMMCDGSMQLCVSDGVWSFNRTWFSPDSAQVLASAPFRPAKVVEA